MRNNNKLEKAVEGKGNPSLQVYRLSKLDATVIGDRGYVLEIGKNRYEGPGRTLLKEADVRGLYLGG